jgi:integrase
MPIRRNMSDLASPPRKQRRQMRVLSPEQARRLLDVVANEPLEALYVVALTAGMRQGELLSLKWRDVDFDNGYVQVHTSLSKTKRGCVFAEPKTAQSRRKVVLTKSAVAALRRHQALQFELRRAAGLA